VSPVLELDGVSVSFGEFVALDDVGVRILAGERVALIGPSGAGKSTLLGVANTVLAPSSGTASLFGGDPALLGAAELTALRRRIGMLHQSLHLPGSLRVVHNVNFGHLGRWSTWRAITSLARPREVDIARQTLANLGLDDKLWQRTDRLSGGERQRVGLARLLVQGAELILADEPTTGLDPARADDVLAQLTEVVAERANALVVSLHDTALARRHFPRIIGLRGGRIMFDLPSDEATPEVLDSLYQFAPT
jgi:phosphonate transport system ATP-binding protein